MIKGQDYDTMSKTHGIHTLTKWQWLESLDGLMLKSKADIVLWDTFKNDDQNEKVKFYFNPLYN